jgi:hypothetical protein
MTTTDLLNKLNRRSKPSEDLVQSLLNKIDFNIDPEYLTFVKTSNGGEGFLNANYLLLYEIEDLIALNPYYEDHDFCNQIFAIGSNGGNDLYAVRKTNSEFITVPFLDMNEEESKIMGANFNEFLNYLQNI